MNFRKPAVSSKAYTLVVPMDNDSGAASHNVSKGALP